MAWAEENGVQYHTGTQETPDAFIQSCTIEEFARDAKAVVDGHVPRAQGAGDSSKSTGARKDWDLGDGFHGTFDKAVGGWSEAVSKIRKAAEPVIKRVTSMIEQDTYYMTDDPSAACEFDVGQVVSGDPFSYIAHQTEYKEGPGDHVITIAACYTDNAGTSGVAMYNRGILATVLAYCFDVAGIPTRVIGVGHTTKQWGSGGKPLLCTLSIKEAGDPLDLNRMAMTLAHPGVLRRLEFAVREGDHREGMSAYNRDGYGKAVHKAPEGVDIYIGPDAATAASNADSMAEWIVDQLKAHGVELRGSLGGE